MKRGNFPIEKAWMDDFVGWQAKMLPNQHIQCGVNFLYPRARWENFNVLFELQFVFQFSLQFSLTV